MNKKHIFLGTILIGFIVLISFLNIDIQKTKYEKLDRQYTLQKLQEKQEALEKQKSDLISDENKELKDEDYEALARSELGLIKKDEIIIRSK